MALMGMNLGMMYTEDTYEVPGLSLIHIFNITSVDTEGFSEKLNLTMASGELPDLIYLVGNAAVQQYGPQVAFINILDYIDQMPNFKACLLYTSRCV